MDTSKTLKEILEYFNMYGKSFFREVQEKALTIWYRPNNGSNKHGFHFVVVEKTVFADNPHEDLYDIVFYGEAHFDGIRHLYMGHALTDNEGYMHYPDTTEICEVMNHLAFLEKRYCTK